MNSLQRYVLEFSRVLVAVIFLLNGLGIVSSPWWNHDSLSDEICIGDSGDFDDG
jgi:hypothetical protein